jgi:hypothetical protein
MRDKRRLNLFYLADPKFGGWATFVHQQYHAFAAAGYVVRMYKLGKSIEQRLRPFGCGVSYQNITLEAALTVCTTGRSIIMAIGPKYREPAMELIHAGAIPVIHDPTEMDDALLKAIQGPVVVQRQPNYDALRGMSLKPTLIRQPYNRVNLTNTQSKNAVAFSRLDWDKLTHVIVTANQLIADRAMKICIYGTENRMYTHHKLDTVDPKWRSQYRGAFPAGNKPSYNAVLIASSAKYSVDMSVIKGDGGDQQMTFLEAWDAHSVLIVNKKWQSTSKNPVVRPGYNAIAVETPEELAAAVTRKGRHEDLIAGGVATLEIYKPAKIVKDWENLWEAGK